MKKEFEVFANGIADTKVLYRLIDRLQGVVKELYHNKTGTITQKVSSLGPSLTAIFNYLEQNKLEPEGDEAQKKYVEDIITYLKDLPIVKVTLAFEPEDQFINGLNQAISQQVGKKIILDLSVNHHIVAGMQMEYQGKFADYSYESQTDKFLADHLQKYLTKAEEVQTQKVLN